jgi:Ca2+-binding EF-hand superfamily protein
MVMNDELEEIVRDMKIINVDGTQYVPLDKFNSVLEKLNEALERELVASGKLMKILAQLK